MGEFYDLALDSFSNLLMPSKYPVYLYSYGYKFVGEYRNEPIKTDGKLTVSTTDKHAPPSIARVPRFEATPLSDRERLALVFCDRLVASPRRKLMMM